MSEGKAQALEIDLYAQLDRAGDQRDFGGEAVGLRAVGIAAHHPQVLADRVVVADVQIVQLGAIVVADQPSGLLEVLRLEVQHGGGRVAVRLLATGDQRLGEHAAQALAAMETQGSRLGAEAEDLFGIGRPQPLEVDGQLGLVEVRAHRRGGPGLFGQVRRGRLQRRVSGAVQGARPAVLAPDQLLDRRLAPQGAAAAIGQRATTEIDRIGLAVGLDQVGMAGALQRYVRPVARGQDVGVGVQVVRAADVARTGHGHGVAPTSAALGGDQIVPATPLVEMRGLGQADGRALEDHLALADQLALGGGELLQHDAGEAVLAGPMIPQLVDQPLAAIVVMEQRRVEAGAVQVDGIRPWSVDAVGGDQVVVEVAQGRARGSAHSRAAIALHVGEDQPELAVGVGQARGPDAAAVGIAAHVQLAGTVQRPAQQPPGLQVARVVDLDAREPLEGRGRDVVVLAHPHDRRIGIEAAQDRVGNHAHTFTSGAARSLTSVHSRTAPAMSSTPRATKNGS